MHFLDRSDAGRFLAERLAPWIQERPCILALPRGGVPVAAQVARGLGAVLDILVVRKIGVPGNEELAMGAVSDEGDVVWDEQVVEDIKLEPEEMERLMVAKQAEALRKALVWRDGHGGIKVQGHTVVLVDDGMATGTSMRAAVQLVRRRSPRRIVVAVPVAHPKTVARLRAEEGVDQVVSLMTPAGLMSVGEWYEDFTQVKDSEVTELLRMASVSRPEAASLPAH